jgi:hypothetical protein
MACAAAPALAAAPPRSTTPDLSVALPPPDWPVRRAALPKRDAPARREALPRAGAPLPAAAAPAPAPTAAPSPGDPVLERVDRELLEIQALVEEAYFPTALAVAGATRELLQSSDAPGAERRWLRLEILAATAALALGRDALVRESLERALLANPGLELEGSSVSPRLVEALAEVRRRQGGGGAAQ